MIDPRHLNPKPVSTDTTMPLPEPTPTEDRVTGAVLHSEEETPAGDKTTDSRMKLPAKGEGSNRMTKGDGHAA